MELLACTIAGGIIGLITTLVWQNGWFKRRELEQKHKIARYKLALENKDTKFTAQRELKKQLVEEKPGSSPLSALTALAPLLGKLDGDQIMELKDTFMGQNSDIDTGNNGSNSILDLIDKLPPGVVEGFVNKIGENVSGGGSGQTGQEIGY